MLKLSGFGYVAVFLQQPTGIGTIACVVIAIAMLWGLFFPPDGDAAPTAEPRPKRRHALAH